MRGGGGGTRGFISREISHTSGGVSIKHVEPSVTDDTFLSVRFTTYPGYERSKGGVRVKKSGYMTISQ